MRTLRGECQLQSTEPAGTPGWRGYRSKEARKTPPRSRLLDSRARIEDVASERQFPVLVVDEKKLGRRLPEVQGAGERETDAGAGERGMFANMPHLLQSDSMSGSN